MPAYGKPSGRDVIENLLKRIDDLENVVKRLGGSPHRSGFDRGDTASVSDPIEGQTMIQYDTETPKYYSNGQWRSFAGSGGTPSVATFYFSNGLGDTAMTVTTGPSAPNITWPHAALPSDGTITGPFTGNTYIQFNTDCITMEFLLTVWDDAGYLKSAQLGTDDRIGFNDRYTLGNAGAGADATYGTGFGDSTLYVRPNAHLNGDLIHAYAEQNSGSDKTILAAYLTIFLWPAPGYAGDIPGYPV